MHFDVLHRIHPVVKWAGGKSRLLNQLIPLFPEQFDRLIEPFFGGGAISLALFQDTPFIGFDTDPNVVSIYAAVKNYPEGLAELLDLLRESYSLEFFMKVRDDKSFYGALCERFKPVAAYAARMIFLNKTCFNGLYRVNKKGEFNVGFCHKAICPSLYSMDDFLRIQRRLTRGSSVYCDSYTAGLSYSAVDADDFIYCDPPYHDSYVGYNANQFTLVDHATLQETLRGLINDVGVKVAVSSSDTPDMRHLYKEWNMHTVFSNRSISCVVKGRGCVQELLFTSY
jgi:DNA adenine methylase